MGLINKHPNDEEFEWKDVPVIELNWCFQPANVMDKLYYSNYYFWETFYDICYRNKEYKEMER